MLSFGRGRTEWVLIAVHLKHHTICTHNIASFSNEDSRHKDCRLCHSLTYLVIKIGVDGFLACAALDMKVGHLSLDM